MSFCSWWTYQRKKFCSRFFLTRSNGKSVRLGGRDWPKDEGSRVLSVSTSRKESIRFVICLLWGFLFYVFRNFLSEVPDLFDGLLVLIFLSWGSVLRREPFSFLSEDQENMKTRSFCEDQDSYETTEKEGDLCLWTVLARYLCGSRRFIKIILCEDWSCHEAIVWWSWESLTSPWMFEKNLTPDWLKEKGIGVLTATAFKREVNRFVISLVYIVFTYNIFRNLTSRCFFYSCWRTRFWKTLSRSKAFSIRI